jgi:hypothetical protein
MSSIPLPPLTREQADIIERMATLARTRFAPRAARHDAELGKGCSSFIDALGTEAQKRRWATPEFR